MKIEDQLRVARAVMPDAEWFIDGGMIVTRIHELPYRPDNLPHLWRLVVFLAKAIHDLRSGPCSESDAEQCVYLSLKFEDAIANNDTEALEGLVLEIIDG